MLIHQTADFFWSVDTDLTALRQELGNLRWSGSSSVAIVASTRRRQAVTERLSPSYLHGQFLTHEIGNGTNIFVIAHHNQWLS